MAQDSDVPRLLDVTLGDAQDFARRQEFTWKLSAIDGLPASVRDRLGKRLGRLTVPGLVKRMGYRLQGSMHIHGKEMYVQLMVMQPKAAAPTAAAVLEAAQHIDPAITWDTLERVCTETGVD